GSGNAHFGAALGSLIFLVNVVLLSLYSFSCHSLRHIIGGKMDCFTCSLAGGARHKTWGWVSILNERHPLWAWLSLFSVLSVDIYIRLLQAGLIQDVRFF
ncbi:succinate dehydrogenase, partial [Candidatus Acetothermia bacterium]|nr:succinate dehydrogenase [Candidatus Acetothermia bacterium]